MPNFDVLSVGFSIIEIVVYFLADVVVLVDVLLLFLIMWWCPFSSYGIVVVGLGTQLCPRSLHFCWCGGNCPPWSRSCCQIWLLTTMSILIFLLFCNVLLVSCLMSGVPLSSGCHCPCPDGWPCCAREIVRENFGEDVSATIFPKHICRILSGSLSRSRCPKLHPVDVVLPFHWKCFNHVHVQTKVVY